MEYLRQQPAYGGNMRKLLCVAMLACLFHAAPALAGDAATIVLKSGIILSIQNGFGQLLSGMKSLRQRGSENYPVEINIEGTSFFINLGEVAVLCRDTCGSIKIERPKSNSRD
jgi:hypothetical protein